MGYHDRYPHRPGFKTHGTSRTAADRIAPHAQTLRGGVHAFIRANYPAAYTADAIAEHLGASILSIRPRVTELRHAGLIEPAEQLGRNKSGMSAMRWRAKVNVGEASQ